MPSNKIYKTDDRFHSGKCFILRNNLYIVIRPYVYGLNLIYRGSFCRDCQCKFKIIDDLIGIIVMNCNLRKDCPHFRIRRTSGTEDLCSL